MGASPMVASPYANYTPAAATVQGYQQYAQYAHSPQFHGQVLSQAQYIRADTNHDGIVSAAELQAVPVKHGLFGNHHGFGIYDHFVNHAAPVAATAPAVAVAQPMATYTQPTTLG